MSNQNTPTHDGWNHRWGCPPIKTPPGKITTTTYEMCTNCRGHLRVRINKDGTIEPYGNNTTEYGGIFCSTGCSISFIQKHKKIENNKKEIISLNIKNDNKNGNIKHQGGYTEAEAGKETKNKKNKN